MFNPIFIAATVNLDLAVVSTGIGIIATLLGGILFIARALNSVENRFLSIENQMENQLASIESKRELDVHKCKSALKFLKYEVDGVKGWLSRETSFQERRLSPNTGADFLNE